MQPLELTFLIIGYKILDSDEHELGRGVKP